jgi:hypothetical protein
MNLHPVLAQRKYKFISNKTLHNNSNKIKLNLRGELMIKPKEFSDPGNNKSLPSLSIKKYFHISLPIGSRNYVECLDQQKPQH